MKSFILPAIIGASVIALATLFYTLTLPDAPKVADQSTEQTSVIATPSQTTQSAVSTPEDAPEALADASLNALVIDIARVQADGMAVFAGRGAPNGTIFIIENGAIFAQNIIDEQGQWVVLPETALAPGAHLLQLEMVTPSGERQRADVSLVVEIAENRDQKPLVALVPQSDEQSPKVLQLPDETVAKADDQEPVTDGETKTAPLTQAETVAEILGQDDIFIQIGSLSWSETGKLSVHGVASGGDFITGTIASLTLEKTPLAESGRWSTLVSGDPFQSGDKQKVTAALMAGDETLAETQLMISRTQLAAGLDGSLMVVVHKGDALWRIAYRSYGQGVRYVDIVRRNADEIDDPDLIYPNQIFAVPGVKNEAQ